MAQVGDGTHFRGGDGKSDRDAQKARGRCHLGKRQKRGETPVGGTSGTIGGPAVERSEPRYTSEGEPLLKSGNRKASADWTRKGRKVDPWCGGVLKDGKTRCSVDSESPA